MGTSKSPSNLRGSRILIVTLSHFASLEVNEMKMKWGKGGKKGRDGVSTGGEWGEELSAQGAQGDHVR